MAEVQKTTREKLVPTREDIVILTLTPDEAHALATITGLVRGNAHTDRVYAALRDAGVSRTHSSSGLVSGVIRFDPTVSAR